MSNDTLHKTIFLNASPEIVWQFLVDKDKLGMWFHPAESNLESGKDYALTSTDSDGNTDRICWAKCLKWIHPNDWLQRSL